MNMRRVTVFSQRGKAVFQTRTVTGIVLKSTPIGDFDKRVVILTKEIGKISAFAKGARKPNSPLIGAVNPFSFGQFVLYEGRSSHTIQQASITNYFSEFREDIERAYYGMYFLEFADYYTREFNDETAMLKLLYQTLRVLVKNSIAFPLVRYIYELKTICINGEAPQVFHCVTCGDNEREVVFSALKGGIVCSECREHIQDAQKVSGSTLYTLQYIVSSSIEKLYTFTVSDEVFGELKAIVEYYVSIYVDREFKSLEILKML